MKSILSGLVVSILLSSFITGQTPKSPREFLGYELGAQFTYHYKAVEYFNQLAATSDKVKVVKYGETYEGRPLIICFISSPENIKNLEEIRKANLIATGLSTGESAAAQKPIIWLSYNVHGNESVGMETSMKTAYTLVSGSFPGVDDWLKECIIAIDPCQNPDGRDRYANHYHMNQPSTINADPDDWSHHEGWPGSRSNHYFFDLNRDWVWQTQQETQQKIKIYSSYMPQVHADFHEMGSESTFFFAPGAVPWHEVITPWQHEFHNLTGLGNAELFDKSFRLYFTKESFDLFCPIYGDTWPLFNGAMGFTFEQGGGGGAGLAVKRNTGDTLTLATRIDGHFMASMATIKVSYQNRERLLKEFDDFFRSGLTKPQFKYATVVIKGNNERSDLEGLLELLDRNQIKYSAAGEPGKKIKGFDYMANRDGETTVEKGDILISAFQPQSHLVKVLFEPDSKFSDSLNYDITAWALPYVYDLKAFATTERLKEGTGNALPAVESNSVPGSQIYAFLVNFNGFNELRLMAELYKKKVNIRYAARPFTIGKINYRPGSLIIARGDNMHLAGNFEKLVTETANECNVKLGTTATGFSEKGIDLGSNNARLRKAPKVGLLGGSGTSSGAFGQLWYFFEQELHYPITILGVDYLSTVNLSDYDIIFMPSGSYTSVKDKLLEYVRGGGRIVALERAVSLFSGEKTTNLSKAIETRTKELEAAKAKLKSTDTSYLKRYENQRTDGNKNRSSGSIYKITLDDSHPYVYGLGKEWFVMKSSSNYPFLTSESNIGYILDGNPVSGFAGSEYVKQAKNTMIIASERVGRGEVVYITEDPYFRAYWKSGRILLGNLVFR